MSDLQVQAELKLKDNLSRPAGTALDSLGKTAAKTGTAVDSIGKSQGMQRTAKDAADAARSMDTVNRTAQDASRSMDATARNTRQVKDAIQAADRQASAMRNNMQGVGQAVRDAAGQMRILGRGMGTAMRGAAALGAAGYVAKAAMDKPVAYEKQLASMSNVAYGDRDAAGRIAGMGDLDAAIVAAVRQGGGTREDAAATLNAMLASGAVDESTAKDKLLPVIMKGATASGASGEELANILLKGISQKQFTADEAELALDKAIKAGEAGQFELKDMARWLPQIISAGKGMKGMSGFDAHLANLQGIAQVTGSNDQAGNAYFNLLGKLTSEDVIKNFKQQKIHLPEELAKGRMQGKDPVSTFVDLVQSRVVAKDKRFQALQKKIAATSDKDERRALMEQAAEILQGTAVGKVLRDREALLGLVGAMNQKDTIKEVHEALQQAKGSTQTSFDVMSSTGDYAQQQLANEKDIATTGVYNRVKAPVNTALRNTAELAQAHPVAAQAAVGGATAATTAAAGGAAVSLLGGGSAMQGAAKGLLTGAEMTAKAAPIIMLGTSALKIHNTANDASLTTAEKNARNMETYGEFGGALAGAGMGAAVGSAFPLIGNIAGAIIGGIMGYISGGMAGKATGEALWGDEAASQGQHPLPDDYLEALQYVLQQAAQQPISVTIENKLDIDGDRIAEAVTRRLVRDDTRR